MNTVKTGSLFAVALVLLCAVCIPSETSDGDGGLSVTISSATFNSYDEMLTIAGTSSETYVNLIITGNGYTSARAQFFVTNDSYSGTISLKGLSAGEYTVTASVSEAVKAEKEFTVPESPNQISVTGVSLSHTALSMTINQSEVLTATVLPSDASDKTVTWSSDKPSVATISNGTITAVSVGEATITVTTVDSSMTASCAVTVCEAPITGITLDKTEITLYAGQTEQLIATLSDGSTSGIRWSAQYNGLNASVDSNGLITPKIAGTNTIITARYGDYSATCMVHVKFTTLSLSETAIKMNLGDSRTLELTMPSDVTGVPTWEEINSSVISVSPSSDGISALITGLSEGKTEIEVYLNNLYSAVCNVTVENPLSTPCTTYHFFIQFLESYDAEVVKKHFTESERRSGVWLTGTGSNAKDALKDAVGSAVTFDETYFIGWIGTMYGLGTIEHDDGSYTYWVQYHKATEDGNWIYNSACLGYLNTMEYRYIALIYSTTSEMIGEISVTGVAINKTSVNLNVGSNELLTATISPSTATNKDVVWSSSDSSVASVDQTGKVIAVKAGTVKITVTTVDGSKTASCTVTVVPKSVLGVSLNRTSEILTIGSSSRLVATVLPADADDTSVTWSSSDTSVATVDGTGKVTAVSRGTAVVTASTVDGSKTASCLITVESGVVEDIPRTVVTGGDGSVTTSEGNKTHFESGVVKTEMYVTVEKTDSTSISKTIAAIDNPDGTGSIHETARETSGDGSTIIRTQKDSSWDASGNIVERKTVVSAEDSVTGVTTEASETTIDGSTVAEFITTIPMTVGNDGGKTSASVGAETVDRAVDQIGRVTDYLDSGVRPVVEISVRSETMDSDYTELIIPSPSLRKISEETDAEIRIVTDMGTLVISSEAISGMSSSGSGSVTLGVKTMDVEGLDEEQRGIVGDGKVYNIYAMAGEEVLHGLNGNVTVSLPYELGEGEDPSKVAIWYLADDGSIERITCTYDPVAKMAMFVTDHFSNFAVGIDLASPAESGNMTGMDMAVVATLIVMILAISGAAVYVISRRH